MEKHRYYCIGNIEKLQLFHIPPVPGLIPNFPEEKKGVQKGVTTPGSTGKHGLSLYPAGGELLDTILSSHAATSSLPTPQVVSRGKIYVAHSLSLGSPLKASLKCPGLLGCPCLSKATVTCPSHPEDPACGWAEQKWSESTVLHGNTQCPLDPFQVSSHPLSSIFTTTTSADCFGYHTLV